MRKAIFSATLFALTAIMMFVSSVAMSGAAMNYDNNTSPMWITYEPRLGQAEENYDYISQDALNVYYDENTISVPNPINDERYALLAKDSTNVQKRLVPGTGGPTSIETQTWIADEFVTVTLDKIQELPTGCSYNNDSRTFWGIPYLNWVNLTTVSTGKVFYRVGAGNTGSFFTDTSVTWSSSWSYKNLADGNSFTPIGIVNVNWYAQILVMYEVKEKAPSIFLPNKYYHVLGSYFIYVQH